MSDTQRDCEGPRMNTRKAYGLSPYSESARTQTAHFVSYTSSLRPKVDTIPSYSLPTRGFIRGSIPLSSTIKRLVRRGSGKANGQKPKMYGHADRIGGQDKGSGKLPALLDYFLKDAYTWKMTTSDSTQRDELASIITDHVHEGLLGYDACTPHAEIAEAADLILSAGYRKPRTITTVEELDALPEWSVIVDADKNAHRALKRADGTNWWDAALTYADSTAIALPATLLGVAAND